MGLLDVLGYGIQGAGAIAQGHLAGQEALRQRQQQEQQQALQKYTALRQLGADQVKARNYGAAMGMQGALFDALNKGIGTDFKGSAFTGGSDNPQTRRAVAGMFGVELPGPSIQKFGGKVGEYNPDTGAFRVLYEDPKPTPKPIVIGEGAVAVDPSTGKIIAQGNPKTFAPRAAGGGRNPAPVKLQRMVALGPDGKPHIFTFNPVTGERQDTGMIAPAGYDPFGGLGGGGAGASPDPRTPTETPGPEFGFSGGGPVRASAGQAALNPYLPTVKPTPQAGAEAVRRKFKLQQAPKE